MATDAPVVSSESTRVDGLAKVTGAEPFAADRAPDSCLVGKALRSPHPHARIVHVDAEAARRVQGVHAVLTGRDLGGRRVGRALHDVPILADDRVRFVGEKVAAVAAEDRNAAEEALSLIRVEYEELPPVFDPLEALEEGAPVLHPNKAGYRGLPPHLPDVPNLQSRLFTEKGDLERGLAESDEVFEHVFTTPTVHQAYLEPHACVVKADGTLPVEIWASQKSPFRLRTLLASITDLSEDEIVVHPGAIGGDFGGKGSFMDMPLCYFLSAASGRPVKMVMTYEEELTAANPRHAAVITVRTGVKRDGHLWARETRVVYDSGAYGGFKPLPHVNLNGALQGCGSYRIPHVRMEGICAYTNAAPGGHYRAPGEAQMMFAVESATDMIARALEMDPYDFRRLNALVQGDIDGKSRVLDDVRVLDVLDAAVTKAGWREPKGANVGRGIAIFNRHAAEGRSSAKVAFTADAVTLTCALPDTGTGLYTTLRDVVARTVGLPAEAVTVEVGTSDAVPPDGGVGATRVTVLAGQASRAAAEEVTAALLGRLAEVHDWNADELTIRDGTVHGPGGARIPFFEAVSSVADGTAPLEATMQRSAEDCASENSTVATAQVAEVAVDPQTGEVTVRSFVTAHDVGLIFNPKLHQGQIEGGFMQGLGYALMEELVREDGRVTTTKLGEYRIPSVKDIPPLTTVLVPGAQGAGPFQVKPIGESALSGVAPAIANAIEDAVGARITSLPLTPSKVLRAIHAATTAAPERTA